MPFAGGFHPPHRMRDERALGVGLQVHPEDALLRRLCLTPLLKGKDYILHPSIYLFLSLCLPSCMSVYLIYALSSICI